MAGSAVVIGASGGIGDALVRALVAEGRHDTVHALSRTGRTPVAGVGAHQVDIIDEASIARAAAAIAADGPVDLVFVASGILHERDIAPEKTFKALDPVALARLFAVNTTGPALVAKHFVPLMPRRGRSIFAALSARVGSIEHNRLGGWYGYRASKAALNQLLRTLAIEVARTKPEAIILGLHPGTVRTELSRPFRGGEAGAGLFTPDESVDHLLRVMASATPQQSGRVLAWDGSTIPA
jgi:NAD(P)-dependent dehydrogenase (short-subunit alcohol dehydrogenase family)